MYVQPAVYRMCYYSVVFPCKILYVSTCDWCIVILPDWLPTHSVCACLFACVCVCLSFTRFKIDLGTISSLIWCVYPRETSSCAKLQVVPYYTVALKQWELLCVTRPTSLNAEYKEEDSDLRSSLKPDVTNGH